MPRYDDEFDWAGQCDRIAARRALFTYLAATFGLTLAGLALIWPFG